MTVEYLCEPKLIEYQLIVITTYILEIFLMKFIFLSFLFFHFRSTTASSTSTESLSTKFKPDPDFDPCLDSNHIVIANEPERSANHHLSLGAGSPICDRTILAGWYRFDSPAGNLIPTECPGENYCGTRKPVWLNGKKRHFFYSIPNHENWLFFIRLSNFRLQKEV